VLRSPWIAGGLGAFVGLYFAPGTSWRERAFNVLCGCLSAGYVAPALTEWLRIEPEPIKALAAFGVGLFGLGVAAETMAWVRSGGARQALADWLTKRKGP
jgi:hypothetical protein